MPVLAVFPHSFPASSPEYSQWILPVLSLLGGGLGGVLGGFLSKRGEITAIQGKLDTVVNQNNRLTLEAEEIKRQVSGRQRIWELKREVAYEITKVNGTLGHLFASLAASWNTGKKLSGTAQGVKQLEEIKELEKRFKAGIESLWQFSDITALLFEKHIVDKVDLCITGARNLFAAAIDLVPGDEKREVLRAFLKARKEMNEVLRDELKKDG